MVNECQIIYIWWQGGNIGFEFFIILVGKKSDTYGVRFNKKK